MDEQRRIRMAAAITVNVILLIVILAAVLIYQLISIGVLSGRKRALEKEISEYERLVEQGEIDLEYFKSDRYLLEKAFELHYVFPSNH